MLSIRCNSRIKSKTSEGQLERIKKVKPSINKYNWEG